MSELDVLQGIQEALVVRPGDTLVVRLPADLSMDAFARYKELAVPKLKECLPGVEVVIVGGVEQLAVYRPGEDDGT